MYCDDMSGNQSKKWNEHNSFLFTLAGLPWEHIAKEYNIHFLCTSNLVPPLEMMDGVVDQIGGYTRCNTLHRWEMQHIVLRLPPGRRSFNYSKSALPCEKNPPNPNTNLKPNPNANPNANLSPNLVESKP